MLKIQKEVMKLCTFGGLRTTDVACYRITVNTHCVNEKLTHAIHQS